jgi:hypothetical protein
MAIEERAMKRDFLFHILLGGCDWGVWDLKDHWSPLWKRMSGGVAFPREIDERIGGLLCHLVIRRNCTLELGNGARYNASDFAEWKP